MRAGFSSATESSCRCEFISNEVFIVQNSLLDKGIWVSTESGQCDGSCVKAFIATQQLKVECQTYGRKILSVDHCDPRTRPNGRKECQTSRCATKLVIGPWGKVIL